MPFINGRYYVNPIMGEALEAAREAEAALLALENSARQNAKGQPADVGDGAGNGSGGSGDAVARATDGSDAPIHRVEIEAAELVPAQSGRAAHGYVARVHRKSSDGAHVPANTVPPRVSSNGRAPGRGVSPADHTETHVFADHRDLVSFLRDALGNNERSKRL